MDNKYLHLSNELEKVEIRPSQQRLKILEYFHIHRNHPTVDDIYKYLKPKMPTITKATIYNNLKIFIEKQLIRDVHIEDNEVRYEITCKRHGHFKCNECGTIYDFAVEMDDISSNELNEFQIDNKNVYFRGICPKCLSK
jgi:Fur family transcriptional regulator, peroxide stress response regulator